MPAKSKAQQRFMGMVHAYKKGELKGSEVSKDVKDAAKGMKKKTTKDYAKTKHKGLPNKVKKEELKRLIAKYGAKKVRETIMAVSPKSDKGYREPQNPGFEYDPESVDEGFGGELKGKDRDKFEKARIENAEQLGYKVTGKSDTKKQKLKMAHELKEAAKRDYKAEYKKFQSSTKSKKYRAELNQYNRKKGTYGNGDGKDASHKGGKIAGFEAESKNRGRREKSRLKKEMSNPTSGIMMARKMSSLEMQQIILLAKAMKQLPGSPAQKKIKKQINVIRKKLGQAPVKESVNEATPKEKGNLRVMKPKFKKTFDMIDKDVTSIYQNLGSVEADKLKKAYIAAINKGLNPRTNMFMKNSAQKILDKAFKNESVNEAPISSPSQLPYSSPEAQKMAEKDIIGMSKILGKASQMSIKKMMDGVKAKKYDAFDLQRAIMSGPIRDTHTGERDFMRVLWNKVRSGFRRYSKRGKLR